MSEMSSSEKPEFCWPNRLGSTTFCVAARIQSEKRTSNLTAQSTASLY